MGDLFLSSRNCIAPFQSPAYAKEWNCRDSHAFTVTLEGSEKELRSLLSFTPFEYVANCFQIWFCSLQGHTLARTGNYLECAVTIPARYNEVVGGYTPYMYCTCIPAILAGREVYGYPKQYAQMQWIETPLAIAANVEKDGTSLMKAAFVFDVNASAETDLMKEIDAMTRRRLLYKVVPDPLKEKPCFEKIIVRETGRRSSEEAFGKAFIDLFEAEYDPLNRLEISRIIGAKYVRSSYGGKNVEKSIAL